MKLINIGFGNMVAASRVLAVISPESAPIKRVISDVRERGQLIDATYGRRTRAVIIMDTGHVIMILTDWEEPFHVISSDAKYVDFENDPSIIAYGRYALSESTNGFIEFELPLEYRSERTPRYLVIVGSSSALGDYFTGGRGSTLWLDDFSLVYE